MSDADGDHLVLHTNGTTITIEAYDHGDTITTDTCTPACNEQLSNAHRPDPAPTHRRDDTREAP